jgi:RNA recognition motif-containing protein
MSYKVYIRGIPYSTTEEDLEEAFSRAGTVASVKIVKDRVTGNSRGFGFVEMESSEGRDNAISMWDGEELGGRKINVEVSHST